MQFNEFGKEDGKVLMLLPGTGCTWELNFKYVIDKLKEKYHIIAVNYDGFETDSTLRTDFTDMLTITGKIEDYIKEKYDGHIDGCYGSSLGGSFVGQMFARNKVHIDHGFLGGSDLDESGKFYAAIVTKTFGKMIENSCRDDKKLEKFKKKYVKMSGDKSQEKVDNTLKFLDMFSDSIKAIAPGTLTNEFYSDYITRLPKDIDVQGSTMHIIYATQMGAKYEKRYLLHFKNPDIRRFDMSHESWLFSPSNSEPVLKCIDECMGI